MNSDTPLVFVHIGEDSPAYIPYSLRLAQIHNRLPVFCVSNESNRKQLSVEGVAFVPLEEFYDPRGFQAAKNGIAFNHSFRSGFWLRSFERLFVMHQFLMSYRYQSVLHAELDQLLFGVDELARALNRIPQRGVFFPFHSPEKAVASILYVNHLQAIASLIEMAQDGQVRNNEMELLRDWAKANPEQAWALPTLGNRTSPNMVPAPEGVATLESVVIQGIVDAAELGLWVGGRDPRNLQLDQTPANHFMYPAEKRWIQPEELRGLQFSYDEATKRLIVTDRPSNFSQRIYNLHLHSKIHKWIWQKDRSFELLFQFANSNTDHRFPFTRLRQVSAFVTERAAPRALRVLGGLGVLNRSS